MQKFFQKGISIIEVLLVISIIGIIILISFPQFSQMRKNQVLKNTVGDIVSSVHGAQSQSLASFNSSEYGIHFQSDQIIVFKGKIFSPSAVDNKVIDIISPASISNVTLNGSSDVSGDLYFERISGIPSKTGTITVSSGSLSKVVTISGTGAVSTN